jgi:hypothetical protein
MQRPSFFFMLADVVASAMTFRIFAASSGHCFCNAVATAAEDAVTPIFFGFAFDFAVFFSMLSPMGLAGVAGVDVLINNYIIFVSNTGRKKNHEINPLAP